MGSEMCIRDRDTTSMYSKETTLKPHDDDVYLMILCDSDSDDENVYYYIRWRLKLEGETENMGVCTKERKGVAAACWKCAAVSGAGAGGRRRCFQADDDDDDDEIPRCDIDGLGEEQ